MTTRPGLPSTTRGVTAPRHRRSPTSSGPCSPGSKTSRRCPASRSPSTRPTISRRCPGSRDTRRERLIALLVLGVALVLLVSSVTWFGTGQTLVGVAQVALGVFLAVVGAVLYRRSQRA